MAGIIGLYFLLALSIMTEALPDPMPVIVSLNIKKASHILDDHFVSLTINPTDLLQGKPFGMGSNITLELLKGLSPGYIRLCGPDTNRYIYLKQHGNQDDYPRESDAIIVTEAHWRELNEMLHRAGMDVIVCLSNDHKDDEKWDPRNALELIAFSEKHGYNLTWQLGYESIRQNELPGTLLGKEVSKLRSILNAFPIYQNSKLVGPDIRSIHRREDQEHILDLLIEAGSELDAITWHPRWPHGSSVKPSDAPDEAYEFPLDYLEWDRNQLNKLLQRNLFKKPLWISEPRGENVGSFAEGLIWARRLALAAKLGIDVVMKQPSLSDIAHPKPEYWVALMHKKFLGRSVFDSHSFSNHSDLTFVAQCTNKHYSGNDGGVSVFAVNTGSTHQRVLIRGILGSRFGEEEVHQYLITPGSLFSQMLYLNGEPLLMEDDGHLPSLIPKVKYMNQGLSVKLPPYSFGFWVVPKAKVRICQHEPDAELHIPVDDLSAKVLQTTQKGVNAIKSMNEMIVDQLLHPNISNEDEKNSIEGELKRPARETILDGLQEELKRRVNEIKDIMTFNVKGLAAKAGFTAVADNQLRDAETKIEDLASDLKTIMSAADQKKEFGKFLEASGLKENFSRIAMEEKETGNELDDEFELTDDEGLQRREKRQIKELDTEKMLRDIENRYKSMLAEQVKPIKVHYNADFGKINKELQEELLLKEVSLLEKSEEQMLAAMKSHQERHELMDKMLKDEVTHLKEEKIAQLLELKTNSLEKNRVRSRLNSDNDDNTDTITRKREVEIIGTKDEPEESPVDPISAIRNLINERKKKLSQKTNLQEKLLEIRNKFNLQPLRKDATTTTTTTTTTEDPTLHAPFVTENLEATRHNGHEHREAFDEPNDELQTMQESSHFGSSENSGNIEKRRAEMLQYMSDVVSKMENKNDENNRKPRKTNDSEHLENSIPVGNKEGSIKGKEMKSNEAKLQRASVLLQKILEAAKELDNENDNVNEESPEENKVSDEIDPVVKDIIENGDESDLLSEEVKGSSETGIKKFRFAGNNVHAGRTGEQRHRESEGQEENPSDSKQSMAEGEGLFPSIGEGLSPSIGEVKNISIPPNKDEPFGSGEKQANSYSITEQNEGQNESKPSTQSPTGRKERKRRDAHDGIYAIQRSPQGPTEDVRQSQDIVRNSILKKSFPEELHPLEDLRDEVLGLPMNKKDKTNLKPDQYIKLAGNTMKVVLDDVIPEAYNSAKSKLEDLKIPEYLENMSKMIDNLQAMENILKVATGEIHSAIPLTEHIQRIDRHKRQVGEELQINDIDNIPGSNEVVQQSEDGLASNALADKNRTSESTTEKTVGIDLPTTPKGLDGDIEVTDDSREEILLSTTEPPTEMTTNTTQRTPPNSTFLVTEIPYSSISSSFPGQDILAKAVLNEVVAELVEEIIKKGENEVEKEIADLDLDVEDKNLWMGKVHNNLTKFMAPQEFFDKEEDPSTPWLESATKMVTQLMADLEKYQETKNKEKREIPALRKRLSTVSLQPDSNDPSNPFRKLSPGIYVVPSDDMLNVHADQVKQNDENMPNVVTLNIYYDKKNEGPKASKDDSSLRAPVLGRLPQYRTMSWPTSSPPKAAPAPLLPQLPRYPASASIPPVAPQAPAFLSHASPAVRKLYENRYHQHRTPSYESNSEQPQATIPQAQHVLQQSIPAPEIYQNYDNHYRVLKAEEPYGSQYAYSQQVDDNMYRPKMVPLSPLPTWSKPQEISTDIVETPIAESENTKKFDSEDSVYRNSDGAWYLRKPMNEPRLIIKDSKSQIGKKNLEPQSYLNKQRSIEPYWNRTLKEIFQDTYNDPFWKFLKPQSSVKNVSFDDSNTDDSMRYQSDEDINDEEEGNGSNRRKRSLHHEIRKRQSDNRMDVAQAGPWAWRRSPAPFSNNFFAVDNHFKQDSHLPRSKRNHKNLISNYILKGRENVLLDSDRVVHDIIPRRHMKRLSDFDSSLEAGQRLDYLHEVPTVFESSEDNKDSYSKMGNAPGIFPVLTVRVKAPEDIFTNVGPDSSFKITPTVDFFNREIVGSLKSDEEPLKKKSETHSEEIVDPVLEMLDSAAGIIHNVSGFV